MSLIRLTFSKVKDIQRVRGIFDLKYNESY